MPQGLPRMMHTDYQAQVSKHNGAAKKVLIAPLCLTMIAGTGGVYTPSNMSLVLAAQPNQIIEVRGYHSKRSAVSSISHLLTEIREMFGLKMSELSIVFGVTRPTAYAWLNGAEPRSDAKAKICNLSRVVDDLRNSGIKRANSLARLPLKDGRSLIDLLKIGSEIKDAVAAIKTASTQNGQRSQFGPAVRKRRVGIERVSVPIIAELGDET